ncbi:MAG: NADH-quinone oxidoreductase subunit C [Chloroflexi bacterium]|nr:NADH-quinone oxidoreductase subunit C [Chloroflexota bacterium]
MTTPESTQERPRRERHEPEAPQAPVVLDAKGEALSALLPQVFTDVEVEIGAAVDEVTLTVRPEDVPTVCQIARDDPRLDMSYLRCLSVVDYIERLEINYHLFSLARRHKMVVKTSVPPDAPNVPSITPLWRGADWFEREGHDLFGVVFQSHPNLSPLLLYEGFEGHPGLKSFPFHDYKEW